MKTFTKLTLSAAVVAALTGCASTSTPPAELTRATEAVRTAQASPDVVAKAPLELKKATESLARANRLLGDREPMPEVLSAAYVAQVQAQTAMALAQAKANDDGVKTAEADRERARADALRVQADRARGDARAAQQDAASANAAASSANAAAMSAEQRNALLESQKAALQARGTKLQAELDAMNAKKTERGMLVTLGDVLFATGRAQINPNAMGALRKLGDFLQQNPERRVLIEGFTDNVGSDASNQQLSQRRADAVATALRGMGVQAGRISSTGYGEQDPVADNSSGENRAMNRRVEVYISETDQPVRPRRN